MDLLFLIFLYSCNRNQYLKIYWTLHLRDSQDVCRMKVHIRMTTCVSGLETLAGRAGQRKSAEDNDGDGSWDGDTCWESRTKGVGRRQ